MTKYRNLNRNLNRIEKDAVQEHILLYLLLGIVVGGFYLMALGY